MGVVFQARHIFLKTSHAIKVILPDLVGNDPMLVTRFRQEALAAAAIRHQNIISVTDFGVVRGTMPFLVMEFVSGKSLQEILAEEKVMSPERALEFACAIGAGVAAAHRQNIVHRDLKPLNIMTQAGQPVAEGLKILDFGLAKIKSGELLGSFVQAKTSGLMGSPFYMAPEQWSDDEPDARADIYSLGIILYQMLAGDVPFKGSSIPSIMKKHLTLAVPSFKSTGVSIAPGIEEVVRHALEKEVQSRTPTVEAFIAELREAVSIAGPSSSIPRTMPAGDPNETIFAPAPDTAKSGPIDTSETVFDREVKVSAPVPGPEEQRRLAASRDAYEREQQERNRIAHEELARESEARRLAAEEKLQKQKELEERQTRERQEREERERQQREQMERVERQAKELEERLARLATSIAPQGGPATSLDDPEATQIRAAVNFSEVGNNSFREGVLPHTIPPATPQSQPGSRQPMVLIGIAVLAVVLIGGSIGAYLLLKSEPAQPRAGGDTNTNQATPGGTEKIKADQVEIPGGTFQMGRNDGPPQEQPQHPATVGKFFMDRTEVTNAAYAEFVKAMNYEAPSHWFKGKPLPGQEEWPVVNVSPGDAQAFAAWRSKRDGVSYRLPTEEEWEFAARNGGAVKLYPWGDRWEQNRAVVREATPRAVGTYPDGKNRWGVVDLIGNVWEWTSSNASVYLNKVEIPEGNRDWVVARGGSYASDPEDRQSPISATYRDWYAPTFRHANHGFRLVRSAE